MTAPTRIVAAVVARHSGIPIGDIYGWRRRHDVVVARHATWILAADLLPHLTVPMIARDFGRCHTSVMYALGMLRRAPTTGYYEACAMAWGLKDEAELSLQLSGAIASRRIDSRTPRISEARLAGGFDETMGMGV